MVDDLLLVERARAYAPERTPPLANATSTSGSRMPYIFSLSRSW
jgi:hypothetical protein